MIGLYITPRDAARVDREAKRFGLPRATWLAALVARRTRGEARFNQADEIALVGIQMELRRLALGLVRLAEPTAHEPPDERGPSVDAEGLKALAAQVRRYMASIREALKGNLDYWTVADE